MKRFVCLMAILALFVTQATAQSMPFEGKVSGIFSRVSSTVSGDGWDLSLQDVGVSPQPILKTVTLTVATSPDLRVSYIGLLPLSESGNGQLTQRVIFNNVTYGPKDSKDTDKKYRDVATQFTLYSNRVEVECMPVFRGYTSQIYTIGVAGFTTMKISMNGVPNSSGTVSGSKNDAVETSLSTTKTILGVGMGGYQRHNNVLFKGKVIYDFLNQNRGWLAQADVRYEIDRRGFVGVGYFYEEANMAFDTMRLKTRIYGPTLEVGLLF